MHLRMVLFYGSKHLLIVFYWKFGMKSTYNMHFGCAHLVCYCNTTCNIFSRQGVCITFISLSVKRTHLTASCTDVCVIHVVRCCKRYLLSNSLFSNHVCGSSQH